MACCGALLAALSLSVLTGCSGVSSGSQSSNQPPSQNNPSAGKLAVSPASLAFGNVAVGNSSPLTGTLTASNADVTVSSADWTGSGYAVSGITFPVTISAGKSANYTVTFTPPAAGSSPGGVTFLSDASDSSLSQPFSGNGTQGQAGQHSVALSWNPSTSSVVGYNVYRGTQNGGPYSKLNSSLEPATAYTDSTVLSGTTYYYVATAVDSNNVESTYSNQAVAQVPNP
jgi:hypothetical protein